MSSITDSAKFNSTSDYYTPITETVLSGVQTINGLAGSPSIASPDASLLISTAANLIKLTTTGTAQRPASVISTGEIAGSSVVSSGPVSGSSITASGAVSGASVSATGAVSGASVTASGAVSGASVSASGAVSGSSISASGVVSGASVTASSTMSIPFLTNGSLNCTAPQPLFGVNGNAQWTVGQATLVIAGWRIIWGTATSGGNGIATVTFVQPFASGAMPMVVVSAMPSGSTPNYVMVGQSGSGFAASPTNTGCQFVVLQTGGGTNASDCAFIAIGPA